VYGSALFVVVPTGLFVLLLAVVHRRWAPRGGWLRDVPAAGGIFSTAGTGLAVLLAFIIVATFDSYQTGRDATGREAVATQQLYAMAGYFDDPLQTELKGETVCYARAVIHDGWPAMQNGGEGTVVQVWVDQMDATMQDQVVTDPLQIEAAAHWFEVNKDRQDGRRSRIAESQPFVPGFLWGALILLTLVVLGYQVLFVDRSARLLGQAGGMGAMAATLCAGLTVTWMIDRPFNDRGAMISPSRMEAVLVLMERTAPSPLPCDEQGNPVRRPA
jgi:hypothetical protein